MKFLLALLALSPIAHAQKALPRTAFAPSARIITLGAPGNIRAVPELGAVLLRLDAPVETRVAAAMALGRIGNWRSTGFLRQALKDQAKEIRFASALALGKIPGADAAPLIDALELDGEWWVRFAAAVALGSSRDPKAAAALGRAAVGEPEWQVRMQAVRSLGKIGSQDAALALARPLRDADSGVRAAAALALSDVGGPDSLALLRAALPDEKAEFPRGVILRGIAKLSRP